ncbi:hypothetical protein OG21DRAFT_1527440 [Imleria badia]|nr:hypothetical protein OG21DRAFT_1527440 [Imleria badia]
MVVLTCCEPLRGLVVAGRQFFGAVGCPVEEDWKNDCEEWTQLVELSRLSAFWPKKYFTKKRTGCACGLLEYGQTSCTLNCTISLRDNVKTLRIHQETVRMQADTTTAFGGSGTHDETDNDDGMTYQSLVINTVRVERVRRVCIDSESRSSQEWVVVYSLLKTNLVPHMETLEWKALGKALLAKEVVGQCTTKLRWIAVDPAMKYSMFIIFIVALCIIFIVTLCIIFIVALRITVWPFTIGRYNYMECQCSVKKSTLLIAVETPADLSIIVVMVGGQGRVFDDFNVGVLHCVR